MKTYSPISIDANAFIKVYKLNRGQADAFMNILLGKVTREIYVKWQDGAKAGLRSTRKQYINSLRVYQSGRFENTIILTGKLPVMIELGKSAFDLKEGILKGKNAKIGKDGRRYNTVPFRHGVHGSLGEDAGFANVMPKQVTDIAKQLKSTVSQFGEGVRRGDSLSESNIPSPYNARQVRAMINSHNNQLTSEQRASYEHKSSIYAGIYKNSKVYEKAQQNTYVSFRRVGEALVTKTGKKKGSAANSWIHKGIQARHFGQKAVSEANITGVVKQTKDEFIKIL